MTFTNIGFDWRDGGRDGWMEGWIEGGRYTYHYGIHNVTITKECGFTCIARRPNLKTTTHNTRILSSSRPTGYLSSTIVLGIYNWENMCSRHMYCSCYIESFYTRALSLSQICV